MKIAWLHRGKTRLGLLSLKIWWQYAGGECKRLLKPICYIVKTPLHKTSEIQALQHFFCQRYEYSVVTRSNSFRVTSFEWPPVD